MATASTLTEQVLAGLRTDILAGRFQPGTKLRVSDLSERFQVSASAVREALNRLSEQGLAESLPHRGFRVTPLSIDDLQDLTRARVLLESMLLRESMRLGDLNWERPSLLLCTSCRGSRSSGPTAKSTPTGSMLTATSTTP